MNSYHSYHYIIPIIVSFPASKDFAGVLTCLRTDIRVDESIIAAKQHYIYHKEYKQVEKIYGTQ